MFRINCLLCGKESGSKFFHNLMISCDSCGTYEITSMAKYFYFDDSRLDEKALKKLRSYLKTHATVTLTSPLISDITGIQSGSSKYS